MNELEEKNRSIALRRAWANKKFGQCIGKPAGCEQGITQKDLRRFQVTWYIPGLGRTTSLDIFCTSTDNKEKPKPSTRKRVSIKCRHCCGCHLTAKCPNRSSGIARAVASVEKDETIPQTYYLGPPPEDGSNLLDFNFSDSEQEHQAEVIAVKEKGYAQINQGELMMRHLKQIMNDDQSRYSYCKSRKRSGRVKASWSRKSPHMVTRKMNNSKRRIKYGDNGRWDFRKRMVLPPGSPGA